MNAAVERIVVQTTRQEKQAIIEKARQLNMTVSELMRSGASAYEPDAELIELATAARASAERSMAVIDETLASVAASNARIALMEEEARVAQAARRAASASQSGHTP